MLIELGIVLCLMLELQWQEANDSRSFGPVNMTDIVGRAIYCLRNAVEQGHVVVEHGPVQNR